MCSKPYFEIHKPYSYVWEYCSMSEIKCKICKSQILIFEDEHGFKQVLTVWSDGTATNHYHNGVGVSVKAAVGELVKP